MGCPTTFHHPAADVTKYRICASTELMVDAELLVKQALSGDMDAEWCIIRLLRRLQMDLMDAHRLLKAACTDEQGFLRLVEKVAAAHARRMGWRVLA